MDSSSSEQTTKPEEIGGGGESWDPRDQLLLYRGLKKAKKDRGCTAKERISKMTPCTAGKRSSIYRGVTRHRWTGRYEAHLWDKSTWNQNQNKKGKQVYLGAYDDEEAAARAYDLAALKYWGPGTLINFPVTDYTRDLEEMLNVSREDYLASLRRKSSGFSRGMKYRTLSSRWDSQFGRTSGADCSNSTLYGDEGGNAGNYGTDRKIDLSNYIKWWTLQKSESHSKSLDEKSIISEKIVNELKALEQSVHPTEPYQMPRLGVSPERKKHKSVSALSILSKSPAYKSLQEKTLKNKGSTDEVDENENKNTINKLDLGKSIQESCHGDESGSERLGHAFVGVTGGLSIQRNDYPLSALLSAPLVTSYNSIDPLTDPLLWSSLAPSFPTGTLCPNEPTKNESVSDYTFFQQGD